MSPVGTCERPGCNNPLGPRGERYCSAACYRAMNQIIQHRRLQQRYPKHVLKLDPKAPPPAAA